MISTFIPHTNSVNSRDSKWKGQFLTLDVAVGVVERLKAVVLENVLGRAGQVLPTLMVPGALPDLVRHLATKCACRLPRRARTIGA